MARPPELEDMQAMAAERGRSKRSLRPEEMVVTADFAGDGVLGSKGDTLWAERATDLREMGEGPTKDEDAVVQRNKLAQEASVGGWSYKL